MQEACLALSTAKPPRKAAPSHSTTASSNNHRPHSPSGSLWGRATLAGLLLLAVTAALNRQALQVSLSLPSKLVW